MALTRKQRLFVAYYLGKAKCNATLAARMAGFGSPNMAGPRMMVNDSIREAIDSKVDRLVMTEEETLARISDLASIDADDFLKFDRDKSPDRLPSLDLRKAKRRGKLIGIREIEARQEKPDDPATVVKVKLDQPLKALAMLAKIHGLLDPKPPAEPDSAILERFAEALDKVYPPAPES
jgi:hypothetical protein